MNAFYLLLLIYSQDKKICMRILWSLVGESARVPALKTLYYTMLFSSLSPPQTASSSWIIPASRTQLILPVCAALPGTGQASVSARRPMPWIAAPGTRVACSGMPTAPLSLYAPPADAQGLPQEKLGGKLLHGFRC